MCDVWGRRCLPTKPLIAKYTPKFRSRLQIKPASDLLLQNLKNFQGKYVFSFSPQEWFLGKWLGIKEFVYDIQSNKIEQRNIVKLTTLNVK